MNATVQPLQRAMPDSVPPRVRNAALRAALIAETRIAEATAQRSRGMVSLVESLARRALADSADIAEARQRLDVVCRTLRGALAAGEAAVPGDLRALAEATLGVFEMAAGPRILIEGPPVALEPEAQRLVSLALFDLASRAERFGALGVDEGRVALDWAFDAAGDLRLTWREFGVRPGAEALRRGAGGALQALLSDSFGAPLVQRVAPFGLVAELRLPARSVRDRIGPKPRRVLVAVDDATVAATLSALLLACGVGEVGASRDAAEAGEVLAMGDIDLICLDDATADALPARPRPATLVVVQDGAPRPRTPGSVLRLPASAARLAEAMACALRGPEAGGESLT